MFLDPLIREIIVVIILNEKNLPFNPAGFLGRLFKHLRQVSTYLSSIFCMVCSEPLRTTTTNS